jgi:hypothetical protein
MKAIAAALIVLAIMGSCDERYRYHCQDPKNWEAADCQPPVCTAAQNCPEYLRKRNHDPK